MKELMLLMQRQQSHLMDEKIFLYGASGHCKVIIDILQLNSVLVEGIFDDCPKSEGLYGIPVIDTMPQVDVKDKKIIIAIGKNSIRKNIAVLLNAKSFIAIHPKATVSIYATILDGSVIMAGATINAGVSIGKHCIINTGSIIEHDCIINDYVHISPNVSLAGEVSVGEGSHIGIAATVIQGIKIGKWTTIGAGTVIIRDVPDYAVVVGNPGKIIKFNPIIN